jgi:protein lifeguard
MADYTYDLEANTDKLSDLPTAIRNATIAKVYALLSLQLLVTFLGSLLVYRVPVVSEWVIGHPWLLYTCIVGTFVLVGLTWCYGETYPHNLLILALFTLCETYSISYVCLSYDGTSVLLAWAMTLTVTSTLSLYVHVTKQDFNFLGAGLYSLLMVLIVGGLFQLLFLPSTHWLNTGMAILGAMVACGYILYDTSELIHRITPDEVVFSCLNLYLDIIMLFLRLLELFGDRKE